MEDNSVKKKAYPTTMTPGGSEEYLKSDLSYDVSLETLKKILDEQKMQTTILEKSIYWQRLAGMPTLILALSVIAFIIQKYIVPIF